MHLAGGRHSEIIARLERHLALAVVQSHQIALACALGSIDPSHPQAIDTFELIIEQWAYDLDARMMAVRGLHRIAPEPPLVLKTLRSLVEKAQETGDILSFCYGLAALDELPQPLNPDLTITVSHGFAGKLPALRPKKRLT